MIRHARTAVLLLLSSPVLYAQEPLPWSPANNPRVTVNPDGKIVVNVVLPGKGTVYLAPLTMSSYQSALASPWWTDSQAGLIGGIIGSAIGLLGGLLGRLA